MQPSTLRATLLASALIALASTAAVGQITLFQEAAIDVILTGAAQTPPVGTRALGACAGRLVPSSGLLELTCSSDVAGAGAVVVKRGSPGAGGTQLFSLGSGAVAGGERTLTETQVAALLTGQLWVAVTSSSHPQGAVAARLVPRVPAGEQHMRFPLREDSLVHSGSPATGSCALRITADQGTVAVVCLHDVASPQEMRVIIDGNVVGTVSNVGSPFQATLPALANNFGRFLDGDFGVVLTSAAFPQGEVGMVLDRCITGPTTLCVTDDRFRVSIEFTAPNRPTRLAGTVPARSDDSGMFWFFGPDNWEVLVKVLNACQINSNFWVFLSANTNVAFEATVYDTLTGRTKVYTNPQGTLAAPRADTRAFPCS